MTLALVAASFVSVAAIAFVVYGGLRVQAGFFGVDFENPLVALRLMKSISFP